MREKEENNMVEKESEDVTKRQKNKTEKEKRNETEGVRKNCNLKRHKRESQREVMCLREKQKERIAESKTACFCISAVL